MTPDTAVCRTAVDSSLGVGPLGTVILSSIGLVVYMKQASKGLVIRPDPASIITIFTLDNIFIAIYVTSVVLQFV